MMVLRWSFLPVELKLLLGFVIYFTEFLYFFELLYKLSVFLVVSLNLVSCCSWVYFRGVLRSMLTIFYESLRLLAGMRMFMTRYVRQMLVRDVESVREGLGVLLRGCGFLRKSFIIC
jgi:hypothetical protein